MIKELISRGVEQVERVSNFCQNVKIEVSISLGDIILGTLILGGAILGVLTVKMLTMVIKEYLRKQKKYNEGVKESISQIYEVINEYKKQTRPEEVVTELVTEVVKPKKTRAMSMKERWADYEAKRAAERENTRQLSKEDLRVGYLN